MIINYAIGLCELGKILVAENNKGICFISLNHNVNELIKVFPKDTIHNTDLSILSDVVIYINELLQGKNPIMSFKLDVRGTAFQIGVWNVLLNTSNTILNYLEIATILNSPNSCRAVAQACAANNIAILIPCHKIIRKDGNLSGYRWGIDKKRILINAIKKN